MNPPFHLFVPWTFACAVAFTWVAASLYLAHLCERIPDIELAKRTKSRARVFAVFFAIGAIGMLVSVLGFALGFAPWALGRTMLHIAFYIGAIGSLIYGFLLIIVWFSYRKPIKRCLRFAKS